MSISSSGFINSDPSLDESSAKRRLERGWVDSIALDKPKRVIMVDEDVKNLIMKSMSRLPLRAKPGMTNRLVGHSNTIKNLRYMNKLSQSHSHAQSLMFNHSNCNKGGNASNDVPIDIIEDFLSIAATFEFEHYETSDPTRELKVVKNVLKRENELMKLRHLCDIICNFNAIPNNYAVSVVNVLASVRECTLNYIESLKYWRESIAKADPTMPAIFTWEGQNYTLKVVNDMDFMSQIPQLVETLGLTPMKMISNPLMLSNTLEDSESWMDPVERAEQDVRALQRASNNSHDEPDEMINSGIEDRIRLRMAERTLLLEIECNMYRESEKRWDFATNLTGDQSNNNNENFDGSMSTDRLLVNEELLMWKGSANDQLNKIDSSLREVRRDLGTDRMKRLKKSPAKNASSGGNKVSKESKPQKLTELINQVKPLVDSKSPKARKSNNFIDNNQNSIDSAVTFYEEFANADTFNYANNPFAVTPPEYSNPGFGNGMMNDNLLDNDIYEDNDSFSQESDYFRYKQNFGGISNDGGFQLNHSNIDQVTVYDIELMINIQNPPKFCLLAAAVTIIFLSDCDEIPEDLSWNAFISIAKSMNLAELMNMLDPLKIPKFKIRAIKPFMAQLELYNNSSNKLSSSGVEITSSKLIKWVQQIMAVTEYESSPPTVSKSPNIPINRSGRSNTKHGSKELGALPVVQSGKAKSSVKAKSKASGNSKEASSSKIVSAITSKKVLSTKVPLELRPFHTELINDIPPHPLLLTILSPQAEPAKEQGSCPDRVILKVYDLVSSKECVVSVNIYEYSLYASDLQQIFPSSNVGEYYRPSETEWWIKCSRQITSIKVKKDGTLIILVSKKLIEKYVGDCIQWQSCVDNNSNDAAGSGVVSNNNSSSNKPPTSAMARPVSAPFIQETGTVLLLSRNNFVSNVKIHPLAAATSAKIINPAQVANQHEDDDTYNDDFDLEKGHVKAKNAADDAMDFLKEIEEEEIRARALEKESLSKTLALEAQLAAEKILRDRQKAMESAALKAVEEEEEKARSKASLPSVAETISSISQRVVIDEVIPESLIKTERSIRSTQSGRVSPSSVDNSRAIEKIFAEESANPEFGDKSSAGDDEDEHWHKLLESQSDVENPSVNGTVSATNSVGSVDVEDVPLVKPSSMES